MSVGWRLVRLNRRVLNSGEYDALRQCLWDFYRISAVAHRNCLRPRGAAAGRRSRFGAEPNRGLCAAGRTARLIAADRRLDVALLSTDGPAPRYAVAAERTRPRIGEPVVALGLGVHVSGPLIPVIIEGSFAGVGRTPAGDPVFVIHAKIPDGASGGSVVDADGSLIGMVIGYYADRPDLGVVRSLPDIADFLWRHGARLGRGAAGEAGSAPL